MQPQPIRIVEIILLIIVVGIAGWLVTKKPTIVAETTPIPIITQVHNPTAQVNASNWQTYQYQVDRWETARFEFQYPDSASISLRPYDDTLDLTLSDSETSGGDLSIFINPDGPAECESTPMNTSKVLVGTLPMTRIVCPPSLYGNSLEYYWFYGPTDTYEFVMDYYADPNFKTHATVMKILSTFMILK